MFFSLKIEKFSLYNEKIMPTGAAGKKLLKFDILKALVNLKKALVF